MALEQLNGQIRNCRKCRLWQEAKHAVPGEGPRNASTMLVGQNPGKEEDDTGKPFLGRAGKFLNATLCENGMKREELFITNIVKHKTPENRKPLRDEIEACKPYIATQIRLIKPKLIILMGETARQIPREHGITYIETYHPSAAMRFPQVREKFKKDFAQIKTQMKTLG